MDLVSYGTRHEASTEAVLEALRDSSKGKLVYETHWPSKNWWQDVLHSKPMIHLDERLLPLRFEYDRQQKDTADGPTPQDVMPSDQSSGESPSDNTPSPKSDDAQDLYAYVVGSDYDVSIHNYEQERLNSVRNAMRKRIAHYEQQNRRWEEQAKKHLMLIERNQTLEYQMQLDKLNQEYLEGLRELAEKSQMTREHHQSHVRHLRNKIKEAELKQKQQEEEEKKREAESQQRAESLRCQCQEMESTLASVRKALGECPFASFLTTPVEDHQGLLDRMARQVAAFGALTAVSREDLSRVLDFATQLNALVHSVVADVEQATKKGIMAQKQEQQNAVVENTEDIEACVQEADSSAQPSAQSPAAGSMSQAETSQLKMHASILDRLEQWQASYKELTQDKTHKKYCFDLLKAVTIPVNALATPSAVKEKLEQLSSLLSGKPFKAGPRTVSTTSHPLALRFCLDKLAEKIVLQGEEQILSNEETAFPVAALAVGLWCRFPDLGDLLLGHFYMRCPALVPIFFSRSVAPSDSEYFKLCGYKSTESSLETESQFHRRITGLMRLYAALLQTPLPPWHKPANGDRSRQPPGSERGWQWLALCLNTPTEDPGLAATLICTFLEVAGWALARDYGRQFRKVLHTLCKDYFPRLKQLVKTTSGPISRLEQLLQQVLRKGHLARPEASLDARVWN
ncbi:mRNA export factor GLE1-like isoform X1 [Dermacentor silvarum]|uniref:mRNA export factor GLE1-like isoform X1 n=1 Tax=Dermacentor silvarum TaxID=543639 RepID=UPI001898DB1B|nr:mRNA export factor GLE1-like isoform X1 [Dermacentor silvarum]